MTTSCPLAAGGDVAIDVVRLRAADEVASRVVHLGSGHALTIRPLVSDDRPELERLYAELPLEDVYLRFFSGCRPSERLLDRWFASVVGVGGRLVAVEDDGEIVGDAGYYPLEDGDAEFDITVHQHHRGWLGPYLLDAVVEHARLRGVRNLVAEIDQSNQRMLALVRERGYATLGHEDTAILRVAIGARAPVPIWPDDVDTVERPRLLIEGRALPLGAEGWARTYDARLIACHAAATEGVSRCPALAGRVCPLAAGADVVIVTFPAADVRSGRLLETHERLHPRPIRCVAGPGARDAPPSGVTAVGPLGPAMIEDVLRLIGRRPQLARRRPTDGEERSGRAGGPEK